MSDEVNSYKHSINDKITERLQIPHSLKWPHIVEQGFNYGQLKYNWGIEHCPVWMRELSDQYNTILIGQ